MDKRRIAGMVTTGPLFRLVRLVLPQYVLLHLFGRRVRVAADRRCR